MPAYLLAQIRVTNEDVWSHYRAEVGPLAEKFGARYLARGTAVEVLEGSHDGRRLVIFEFPSMESIHTFWNSAEYAKVKALRAGAATLDVWAVSGI